jgi:hypothetical protein
VRDTTDYLGKAIETAAKIATLDGKCAMEGCRHTREGGFAILAHHVVHVKYKNTAADPENLFPVCLFCHGQIHANETAFREWLAKRSPGLYDRLWEKARAICRLDFQEVYAGLLERLLTLHQVKHEAEKRTIEEAGE